MWKKVHLKTLFIIFLIFIIYIAVSQGYSSPDAGGIKVEKDERIAKRPDYRLLVNPSSLEGKDFETVVGFWIAVFTLIIFLILLPVLEQGKHSIGVYRPYEERLLKLNRLALDDLLAYHSQFKWGAYSGIAIGMVLLSITLMLINIKDMTQIALTIQSVIVLVMVIAVILLVFGDLVHTNTQTPIIPVKTRFKLISLSVRFGTLGAILLIFAVLLFTCMVSLYIELISCISFVIILLYSSLLRRIPKEDFFRYFGIIDDDFWLRGGEGLAVDDKRNKLFSSDPCYIKKWRVSSQEIFYQKMRSNRPLSVAVEEWIQQMMASGSLNDEQALKLRTLIPATAKTATQSVEDRNSFLIDTFVTHFRPFLDEGGVSRKAVVKLLKAFSTYFQWTSEEKTDVSNKLGLK